LSAFLNKKKLSTTWVDARTIIKTDNTYREGVFTTNWSKIGLKLYTKLKTEKHTKMENSEISDTVKSKCKYLLEAQTIAWQKSL